MRQFGRMLMSLIVAMILAAMTSLPIAAYGGGADHDMWQVGVSFNCNNPDFCGENLGGFWGWAEFDRSTDGSVTWGDGELAGCTHSLGSGGFNGASHLSFEITSWTIEPGTAGPQTFYIDGEQTESFRGDKTTVAVTHFDTGITAVPGHYSTSDVLGFDPPPGVAIQIQIAFRSAR
jgi:hypothetical protein